MSDSVRINSGVSLGSFIKKVIGEATATAHEKALREKENQVATAAATSQVSPKNSQVHTDSNTNQAPANNSGSAGQQSDDEEKMKSGNVELNDIVDKLNSIRAGKSFKDSAIQSGFNEYFNKLTSAERTSLFTFLKAIAQIVTGEVPVANVPDPSEPPSSVQSKKGEELKQHKTIKPNVIKRVASQKTQETPQEDTTPPAQAPITAKKR